IRYPWRRELLIALYQNGTTVERSDAWSKVLHADLRSCLEELGPWIEAHHSMGPVISSKPATIVESNEACARIKLDALVLKGGGVKGLAFAGALLELECFFKFDTFVGTSAGAIASVLLAAGYSAHELQQLLESLDFKSLLSRNKLFALRNLLTR